jgi:hypothetical protein
MGNRPTSSNGRPSGPNGYSEYPSNIQEKLRTADTVRRTAAVGGITGMGLVLGAGTGVIAAAAAPIGVAAIGAGITVGVATRVYQGLVRFFG